MGKCYLCEQETDEVAMVYIGIPNTAPDGIDVIVSYNESKKYCCGECVREYQQQGFSGILFCLALQLSWFSVIKLGFFDPIGVLSAAIGCVGLWRLFVLIKHKLARHLPQASNDEQQDEASDLYKSSIYKQQRELGRHVLSRREYSRVHSVT